MVGAVSFINDATPEQIGDNIAKAVAARAFPHTVSTWISKAVTIEATRTIGARNLLHKQEILAMDEANQALKQRIEELESAAESSETKESNVNNEGFIPETFRPKRGDRVTIKNKETGVTLVGEYREDGSYEFGIRLDGTSSSNFFRNRDWVIEEVPAPVKDGYYAKGNLIYLKEDSRVITTNLRHLGSGVVEANSASPLRGNSAKAAEEAGFRFLGAL